MHTCLVQVTSPTIHWTLPYERGSEGVSIATSSDGGLTWQKDSKNPVILAPPEGLQVTGFRDPSISSLPMVDILLGRPKDKYLYATLSGGLVGRTPTVFLYSLAIDDLGKWKSLGPIINIGLDYRPDKKWCGEGGRNFECCSLFELDSLSTLITSTEGGKKRWSLWMQGAMTLTNGSPSWHYTKSGVLDWGCFYAASTSQHPSDGRRLIMGECGAIWYGLVLCTHGCTVALFAGWIPEDDLTVEQRRAQGWAGMACLPRELVSLKYHGVTKALASRVSEIGSVSCVLDEEGGYTVQTVGIRPAKEVSKLREGLKPRELREFTFTSSSKSVRLPVQSKTWELAFEADILPSCSAFNIVIQHSTSTLWKLRL